MAHHTLQDIKIIMQEKAMNHLKWSLPSDLMGKQT